MKEATYGSSLAIKIEREIGGKVIKVADKATLGLPDYLHLQDSICTFIETKIGHATIGSLNRVNPKKAVNDIRQLQACRLLSRYCLVLYAIYYPDLKMTAVVEVNVLERFTLDTAAVCDSFGILRKGHGIPQIKEQIQLRRSNVFNTLAGKL